jgi:hypothetical protein
MYICRQNSAISRKYKYSRVSISLAFSIKISPDLMTELAISGILRISAGIRVNAELQPTLPPNGRFHPIFRQRRHYQCNSVLILLSTHISGIDPERGQGQAPKKRPACSHPTAQTMCHDGPQVRTRTRRRPPGRERLLRRPVQEPVFGGGGRGGGIGRILFTSMPEYHTI